MTKRKKPLVLKPAAESLKLLETKELEKVVGGCSNIPRQPDSGGDCN